MWVPNDDTVAGTPIVFEKEMFERFYPNQIGIVLIKILLINEMYSCRLAKISFKNTVNSTLLQREDSK